MADMLPFISERAMLKVQMRGEVHCKFLGGEWRKILRGSLRDVEKLKGDRGGLARWLGSTAHALQEEVEEAGLV